MCTILFAFDTLEDRPLILLANRDEFYERPAKAAAYWNDFPQIYAGRDLVGGGTWLGVTKGGRFAAVTNYRDPSAPSGVLSRGDLVVDFLRSEDRAECYLSEVNKRSDQYSGFNLVVGEISKQRRELCYFSNRGDKPKHLSSGIYGLSNHLLDTPWPKVVKGKARLAELIAANEAAHDRFFEILSDESLAPDEDLPSTGISYEAEKALSATFIKTPGYGTRCSTLLRFNKAGEWDLEEKVFV